MQKHAKDKHSRPISNHGGLKAVSGNVPKTAAFETTDISSCRHLSTPIPVVWPILYGSWISCTPIPGCQWERNWWLLHLSNCLGNLVFNIISEDMSHQIPQSWTGRELFATWKDGSKLLRPRVRHDGQYPLNVLMPNTCKWIEYIWWTGGQLADHEESLVWAGCDTSPTCSRRCLTWS